MNAIESDKRFDCLNGNQFKESVVVKSSFVKSCKKSCKKLYDDNNYKNL